MARARRAKTRPSRVLVPILIALVVVATAVAWQVIPRSTNAQAGPPAAPASRTATGDPTASSSPTASSRPTTKADGADPMTATLRGCRTKVADADAVLAAAKTGIGHWADHVQAQTDANAGTITVTTMDATFARTRLDGPDDQERYRKALADYRDDDGACSAVDGASTKDAGALARCRARASAQHPVMDAAGPAMADWKSHLAAMARSRMHHMDDAEQIWIDAWRAAPPHLKAYAKAAEGYQPRDC